MAGLLKRLSTRLADQQESGSTPRALKATASFNDFSMHAEQDTQDQGGPETPSQPSALPPAADFAVVGSAPAGSSGFSGLAKSMALRIPRTSVAHLLEQRLRGPGAPGSLPATPRSSLDVPPAGAGPGTPRAPAATTPSSRSPLATASSVPAAGEEPASPRSPRTPGGRRRRSGKIDGMDYYDFCELVRTSSL